MSSPLMIKPNLQSVSGQVQNITPASARWRFVGFEVFDLGAGQERFRDGGATELCLVLLAGIADVQVAGQSFTGVGGRRTPFEGKPFAVYVPPGMKVQVRAQTTCEIAIGSAPAEGRFPPRLITPDNVHEEVRGSGTNRRTVYNILPETESAERLLLTEVRTPAGHWSSYPPHKHDTLGETETQLEETYYHRILPSTGFAFQRVWTDDRSLDETMAVEDRDVVLVPRGYHPVGAPHGIELYYLNVMAGPVRRWQFSSAPGYEFLMQSTDAFKGADRSSTN